MHIIQLPITYATLQLLLLAVRRQARSMFSPEASGSAARLHQIQLGCPSCEGDGDGVKAEASNVAAFLFFSPLLYANRTCKQ
jgi:hypothetical protein